MKRIKSERLFTIVAASLFGVASLFNGCTPAPAPKPWKPAPLPPRPLPQSAAEPTVGPEELERTIRGPITQYTPSDKLPPPKEGNFGWKPDAKATQEFLDTLPARTLFEANPALKEPAPAPKPKDADDARENSIAVTLASYQEPEGPTLLYRALLKIKPDWQVGSQGIGDCVSWGWAHGCDLSLAVDNITGVTGEFKFAATEAIYGGSRVEARGRAEGTGGNSDGSYGGAAAKWMKNWGVVWRQQYADPVHDLTTYSAARAKSWGNWGNGGQGDNGKLDAQAKKFPAGQVALVRSFAEAAAAIKSGYPVPVCSGQGFSKTRDADGFAAASGGWAHCMCFSGVRFNPNGLLCQNSWGTKWISGPVWPEDQPAGSFWVKAATADRMLSGGDSFAVSQIKGFPKRQLRHDLGW